MAHRILSQALALVLFVGVPTWGGAGETTPSTSPFKGEYFVTRGDSTVCVPFVRNLNQFRRLDFAVCHPRLSEKYPEFSRPTWDEIPFDLALAETIIKNLAVHEDGKEPAWQAWLTGSAPLRAAGKIKLWRTRIDIDGDGAPETLLRLFNPLSTQWKLGQVSWTIDADDCVYRRSMFYMLDSSNRTTRDSFNQSFIVGDIIAYQAEGQTKYFALDGATPPSRDGQLIGATQGVTVYSLSHHGAAGVCDIDWVPTGHYRPLKRPHTPRERLR